MAVFIIRAKHGETFTYGTPPDFTDVTNSHWAFKYIQKMYEDGISTKYEGGTYGPTDLVNRAQMAVFLARAFQGIP